ncbi:50S ribosomal protein L23 [Candidatus Woesearchaeota archaeon]|nr:50S ribosomal protein L23 [Candidatus Woesearchaeota archaeon]
MDIYHVVRQPLSNEKAIRLMESENKLVFVIDRNASKLDVSRAVERLFKVKVTDVNTYITAKGEKRAYVRLSPEHPAIDVMTQLGLM